MIINPKGEAWPIELDTIDASSADGALLRTFRTELPAKGYPWRPWQSTMALKVQHAFRNQGVLLADAGVGIGKSFAYLIPVLRQGRGLFVISTATLVLQNQLYDDIQSLLKLLDIAPNTVTVTVSKGEERYTCRQRIARLENLDPNDEPAARIVEQFNSAQRNQLHGLDSQIAKVPRDRDNWWDQTTVEALNVGMDIRRFVAVRRRGRDIPSECSECVFKPNCGFEAMRNARRRNSVRLHILIVNHGLLLADLKIRGRGHQARGLWVQPTGLIIDEAHAWESQARDAFTSHIFFQDMDRVVGALGRKNARIAKPLAEAAEALKEAAKRAWDDSPSDAERISVVPVMDEIDAFRRVLDRALTFRGFEDGRARDKQLEETIDEWEKTVERLSTQPNEPMARMLERTGLAAVPGFLGDEFSDLWEPVRSVPLIFCSATLLAGRSFEEIGEELGVHQRKPDTIYAPSPFPYASHLKIFHDRNLPRPPAAKNSEEPEYCRQTLFPTIRNLVHAAQGRTLILATSHHRAQLIYEDLKHASLPYPVLSQSDERATERFAQEIQSILVGTGQLFVGLDVTGDSLSLVVIDRIPFPVPGDPLWSAKQKWAQTRGKTENDAKWAWAGSQLIQGAGRLIRSMGDRGVLALLDPRHPNELHRLLPPGEWISSIDAVRDFLDVLAEDIPIHLSPLLQEVERLTAAPRVILGPSAAARALGNAEEPGDRPEKTETPQLEKRIQTLGDPAPPDISAEGVWWTSLYPGRLARKLVQPFADRPPTVPLVMPSNVEVAYDNLRDGLSLDQAIELLRDTLQGVSPCVQAAVLVDNAGGIAFPGEDSTASPLHIFAWQEWTKNARAVSRYPIIVWLTRPTVAPVLRLAQCLALLSTETGPRLLWFADSDRVPVRLIREGLGKDTDVYRLLQNRLLSFSSRVANHDGYVLQTTR